MYNENLLEKSREMPPFFVRGICAATPVLDMHHTETSSLGPQNTVIDHLYIVVVKNRKSRTS